MTVPVVSRLTVKLPVRAGGAGYPRAVVPLFHRFIQENALSPDLLIDVADYSHLSGGPGVVLVGHEIHYGLDDTGGTLGLLVRRAPRAPRPLSEELTAVWDRARRAASLLESETPLRFATDAIVVGFPDRLNAPGTREVVDTLRAVIRDVAHRPWPGALVQPVTQGRGPVTFLVAAPASPRI